MAIKYIQPVAARDAQGLVAEVYAEIKRDFGALVEPFTLHSPAPKLLAGAWMACREAELVGSVRRAVKEAVAAAVSEINQCPYCVDAHTIMLNATGYYNSAQAISKERYGQILDAGIRSHVEWALATRSPGSAVLLSPPFSGRDTAEMVGTAIFFHYINRMVSVLLSETPLPSNRPWLKPALKRVAGWFFRRSVRRVKSAGQSLRLLPEAPLPADLAWAKTTPTIAGAFARFAAAVEEAGSEVLSEEVRACVHKYVQDWNGENPGLSRGWVEQALGNFDEVSQTAASLALLTALAPYQVDERVIDAFRAHHPEDSKLVGALAWASFAAARRIGTWLSLPG